MIKKDKKRTTKIKKKQNPGGKRIAAIKSDPETTLLHPGQGSNTVLPCCKQGQTDTHKKEKLRLKKIWVGILTKLSMENPQTLTPNMHGLMHTCTHAHTRTPAHTQTHTHRPQHHLSPDSPAPPRFPRPRHALRRKWASSVSSSARRRWTDADKHKATKKKKTTMQCNLKNKKTH